MLKRGMIFYFIDPVYYGLISGVIQQGVCPLPSYECFGEYDKVIGGLNACGGCTNTNIYCRLTFSY